MKQKQQQYLFIGCGNMAKALIDGLLQDGVPAKQIMASCRSPDKHQEFVQRTQISLSQETVTLAQQASVIVLAVKPTIIPSILTLLKPFDLSDKLIISVAAGITCQQIASTWSNAAIIRAMPNTPASIQQGATGLFANNRVKSAQKITAETLFNAVGITEWLQDESQINLVTAISGSSPAYCFLFIQAMVEQAKTLGMEPSIARQLASQAMLGAAQLAQANPQQNLQQLIEAVTSKGGTTEAAIQSLQQSNFTTNIKNAVISAYQRAKQLGENR